MVRRHRPGLDPAPKKVADVVERAVARSDAERSLRLVNKKRFCELTGYDRKTLDDWISKGCPDAGPSGKGAEILVDIRAVLDWREKQVAAKAIKGLVGGAEDAGGIVGFMGIRDPEKAMKAMITYMTMAEKRRKLLHRESQDWAAERAMNVIRNAVMGIPDRIFREMAGLPPALTQKWRNDAVGYCRAALVEGDKAVKAMVPPEDADA